jgi:Amt family ammonium transporter
VGALLTGVFCFMPVAGLAYGGGGAQLVKQAAGAAIAIVFAMFGTFLIARVLKATIGLRTSDEQERDGLDVTMHGERAYHNVVAS